MFEMEAVGYDDLLNLRYSEWYGPDQRGGLSLMFQGLDIHINIFLDTLSPGHWDGRGSHVKV